MHDRFSQEMPWEEIKTIDVPDHNGDRLVVGQTYYEIEDVYVHEDEVLDYIKSTYTKFEM